MPAPANLVHQQSASTGTGDFTLAAVNGKQGFATAFGTGATTDVFDYFISNRGAAEWERGTGHMSDSTTLVRDTVIESTNSNAAVDFTAGTKDVMNDVPAAKQVTTDDLKGPTVQVFTSSGTWTKPAGCVKIKATIIGGGGGGGGIQLSATGLYSGGGGGGAGGLGVSLVDVTSISSLSVTVGAAGSAGDGATSGGFGGTGGTSQLGASGANGQATGGSGGNGRSASQGTGTVVSAGGTGGSASGCNVNGSGEPGGTGFSFSATNGQISGPGGSSVYGGGGVPVRPSGTTAVSNGASCSGYGGGGSGAAVTNSTTNTTGGAGGPGIVIIEEYYA